MATLGCLALLLALWLPQALCAQAESAPEAPAAEAPAAEENGAQEPGADNGAEDAAEERAELPAGFASIRLGMDMETVKERLSSDPNFYFRGDPDVSMLREPNDALIECRGYAYIDRAAFQFVDDGLYTITLILDRELIGFFTMFSTLQEKYGRPDSVSPEKMLWESEAVILALERPLRVKYIGREVLERLREESRREQSLEQLSRERFLDQF
jgi:hypothetical protein